LAIDIGSWQSSASQVEHNAIAAHIGHLSQLTALQYLSLSATDLSDLTSLKGLPNSAIAEVHS
jgi:Leucine-rich repeat (LRR) protein